jgi:ribose 5-phosphate isomerase B
MNIYLASDHGGYNLKNDLKQYLNQINPELEILDLGPAELDLEDDYPDYAFKLASKLAAELAISEQSLGILICRSGNGMAIAANKVKNIRAALCFSPEHAVKARQHDHANILVLDADYLETQAHQQIVESFITAEPDLDSRHLRRVQKIINYEQNN